MSAIPTKVTVVTDDEARDIYGKRKSLTKLIKHERAQMPELAEPISHLNEYYDFLLNQEEYEQEDREVIDDALKCMGMLENLLILVIIQKKDFDKVLAQEAKKENGEFLNCYKSE